MVRIDEARESARLIGAAAGRAPDGPQAGLAAAAAARAAMRSDSSRAGAAPSGTGCWRGAAALRRVKVVDPSFRNWPALEYAVLKNIVPDFPLCNKSFNLSYSGNDL